MFLHGNADLQIPVAAAHSVDKRFFRSCIPQRDLIDQTKHAAQIGCFYTDQFMAFCILCKQVIKNAGIIQIFRNGDP